MLAAQSCPTVCDPMGYSPPGSSLSMGFCRQEYRSGLLFPSPGDLSNRGIEPGSPALQVESLPSESPRKLIFYLESWRSFPRTYMWLMTERQARCLIFNIMAYVSSTWIKHYIIQQVFTSYLRWDPNSIMPLGYKQWLGQILTISQGINNIGNVSFYPFLIKSSF